MIGCTKWSGSCSLCPYAGYEPCPEEFKELAKKIEEEIRAEVEEDMGKKVFCIHVHGKPLGYSFAVKCYDSYNEQSVIDLALKNGLFRDKADADRAEAWDITNSEYDLELIGDEYITWIEED